MNKEDYIKGFIDAKNFIINLVDKNIKTNDNPIRFQILTLTKQTLEEFMNKQLENNLAKIK